MDKQNGLLKLPLLKMYGQTQWVIYITPIKNNVMIMITKAM